jgi:hypothetical protein
MLYILEIRCIGDDLASAMQQMRRWLDHHRIEAAAFDHSSGGPGITFRIFFSAETEARMFAQAFGGRLNDGANPGGAPLWAVGDSRCTAGRSRRPIDVANRSGGGRGGARRTA